jgi:hypothetical protein
MNGSFTSTGAAVVAADSGDRRASLLLKFDLTGDEAAAAVEDSTR